jgi:hypothetical protein
MVSGKGFKPAIQAQFSGFLDILAVKVSCRTPVSSALNAASSCESL